MSDWASRIPSAPEMMKAGISKIPCGQNRSSNKCGGVVLVHDLHDRTYHNTIQAHDEYRENAKRCPA